MRRDQSGQAATHREGHLMQRPYEIRDVLDRADVGQRRPEDGVQKAECEQRTERGPRRSISPVGLARPGVSGKPGRRLLPAPLGESAAIPIDLAPSAICVTIHIR